MSIILKTEEEIAIMKEGGKILHDILHSLKEKITPGIKTYELEEYAQKLFKKYGVEAAFKGYQGYPAAICTSVNEEVVHSVPGNRILREGDIISIDAGVRSKGLITDSAITVKVGNVAPRISKFIETCEKALQKAIDTVRPGIHVVEIGTVIQEIVEGAGYSIVKDLIGHGVGKTLHEDPEVPNFKTPYKGPILEVGTTFAIEPIMAMGEGEIETLDDKWTIVTRDRSVAVQVEHTVAITPNGCEVLTK
ncbi:MAG: type I methionyl aminopeptidase [Patescibacteria group bacterium]|nr:type I methionyl aminopeptidase [Patescibacteria group bacterium]